MSYLERITECNTFDPASFLRWEAEGRVLGSVHRDHVDELSECCELIERDGDRLILETSRLTPTELSEKMEQTTNRLAARGLVRKRGEMYSVPPPEFGRELFRIDRSLAPLLGIPSVGVHLNGFVRSSHETRMWVGRRSDELASFQRKLDNLVAGGQPAELSIAENLTREAWEEAGIPRLTMTRAHSVGYVSYIVQHGRLLRPGIVYCFDLELEPDFVPESRDGEVEAFELLPVEQVATIVRETRDFKFNCSLVIIDFLVRHGFLGPADPDYFAVVSELRTCPETRMRP